MEMRMEHLRRRVDVRQTYVGLCLFVCLSALSAGALLAENRAAPPVGDGLPQKVLYAKGGATPTRLDWTFGGEQPVVALDYGGRTVGGYAVIKVKSFRPQGRDTDGNAIGYPVLRLSYATHPDGLTATGDFTRRNCIHYLGPYFDNPVLPANVNRHETYTVTRTGTYVAPLVQGQERYVRVQLETPGTAVELEPVEIRNVGVHATEPPRGAFRCSDERLNRVWDMCTWTCSLASVPNNDAWRVVEGRLLPRKLERGAAAGLCSSAAQDGDGSWTVDFALSENPHHDSAVGLLFRAADGDNGLVAVASQPAYVQLLRLKGGVKTELAKMVLDARLVDGVFHRLTADVKGNKVGISVDGVRILEQAVGDLPGGRFGLYVEKEWWPQVESYAVADADGQAVFRDDFGAEDAEGRLDGWDYTTSFRFVADGAKRDRLAWIGDIWWGDLSCYTGYGPDWPYLRETLKLFAHYQTPEGYIWAAPFSEKGPRPKAGEFGHFPSDEFCAWFVPILKTYYLYTADRAALDGGLFAAARKCLGYLDTLRRPDGLCDQPLRSSSNIASMAPTDPSIRLWTHLVFWRAYADGAWLAEKLGDAASAARWTARAQELSAAIRTAFKDGKTGLFRRRLGDREPAHGGAWSGMPVACGFATPEEALEILRRVPLTGGSKAHLGNIRGAFAYGFDEKAFAMLENGTWLKLADPSWEGAQCCTECGFLTRSGWWDESHPDTAVSGDMTAYLLGVRPVEPGFATFRFEPHVVSRLTFAEGTVPTPHGDIAARWERTGDAVAATLTVPAGTTATFGCRLSKDVTVDGAPYAGGALGPGRHAIAVWGVTAESFADAALWGGNRADGEDWRVLPGMDGVADANPEAAFELVADLGATYELRAAELTAGPDNLFPSEIRIEASADGKTFTCLAHQTRVRSPGTRRTLELDLCTVGSDPVGRYVKFIFRRPPVSRNDMGEPWYNVVLPKIRVRVGR